MGLGRYIKNMNKKAMMDKVESISQKTGHSKAFIFTDMVGCGLRYGAGYLDYDLFEMYNMTPHQRSTILTRNINNKFVVSEIDANYLTTGIAIAKSSKLS